METSLHRKLKELYATDGAKLEVAIDGFRIDVVRGEELIEIQHGSLAAIRDKIRRLLGRHRVRVVKPIVGHKLLVVRQSKGGRILRRRQSPKHGQLIDLFDELVHFTSVFPHRALTLEILLVDIEEWRYPGHGRRRRHRENDHLIEDQRLVAIHESRLFNLASDLRQLIPARLPRPFHTGQLAQQLKVSRWQAQRIAYCLRTAGEVQQVGKSGNTRLYEGKWQRGSGKC